LHRYVRCELAKALWIKVETSDSIEVYGVLEVTHALGSFLVLSASPQNHAIIPDISK
jgi:hypothetical protein